MTDDLISRQEAIDFFLDKGMITAAIYAQRMPSAERKTGTWIMINDHTAVCSRCNERRWTNGHDQTMKGHIFYAMFKYCPECGALMVKKQ